MSRIASRIIVALMFIAAPTLLAQTMPAGSATPDTPETLAVKTSAKAFVLALADKDIAAAKKLFAGTDEDFKLAQAMHDMMQAAQHVKTAAEAKWPEEMKKENTNGDMDPQQMALKLDHESVTVKGDTAVFSDSTTLRKVDGQWKVVDLVADPMGKNMMAQMMPTVTQVMEEIAGEIEQGRYKSFAEVKTAGQTKMSGAMKPVLPTTRSAATQR